MESPGLLTADDLWRVHIPDKRVADWLSGGALLVWVIDPERRLARAYRSDGMESIVAVDGALEGEDVLPGFFCPLASIL